MRQGCSIRVLALYIESNVLGRLLELGGELCFANDVGVFFETGYLCLVFRVRGRGRSVASIVARRSRRFLPPSTLGFVLVDVDILQRLQRQYHLHGNPVTLQPLLNNYVDATTKRNQRCSRWM